MSRQLIWRFSVVALLLAAVVTTLRGDPAVAATQSATPTPIPASCDTVGTPAVGMDMSGMDMSMASPTAAMEMGTPVIMGTGEIDRLYIDMMIPHHASIVALAQASLPRLTDERLVALAEAIVTAQTTEIEELGEIRLHLYGSAEPMMLTDDEMMRVTPSMAMPMGEMMAQMDAATQVQTFCAATDPDLAFIDLVIPHHQSAIMASETVIEGSTTTEVTEFAGRVIDAQRREIEDLTAIRVERYGSGTPEPVGT